MAAHSGFSLEGIRYFIQERGGRVTNHELVSNFRSYLNDPQQKNEARLKFKEYVNTLATVKQINGVKYLVLKSGQFEQFDQNYRNESYTVESPLMSPVSLPPQLPLANDKVPISDNSMPPMAKLPTRTLFEEVCQAVQQQTNVMPIDSSPSNLKNMSGVSNNDYMVPESREFSPRRSSFDNHDHYNSIHRYQVSPPQPCYQQNEPVSQSFYTEDKNMFGRNKRLSLENIQQVSKPRSKSSLCTSKSDEIYDENLGHFSSHNSESTPNLYSDASDPNLKTDYKFQKLNGIDSNNHKQLNLMNSAISESSILESCNNIPNSDNLPHPPPRRKSINNKSNIPGSTQNVPKESFDNSSENNVPNIAENADVLSPISVRERAQKLNKICSESELNVNKNKKFQGELSKGDDDDSTSVTSLDPLHKQWTIASSKCDYNALLRLLKTENKLYRAKDYISTALHWGAKNGNCDIIKLIAGRCGINPNVRSGYTALHLAAMQGHEDVMDLLIETYGANCNIRDYSGKKPRQYMGKIETVDTEQIRKIYLEAQNKKSSEKDSSSFLRIGSLNVKVQKTISSMSLKNSHNKSWGSADNLQQLLEKQQMPAPKFVPVKRNKSKKMHRHSNYLDAKFDINGQDELRSSAKNQHKAQRRSSFHIS